ncbi:MAG TPA: ATP-binding protein, partial [Clostridia bacterium]|nr:ATP-binding protein [Clostridia bacterium]
MSGLYSRIMKDTGNKNEHKNYYSDGWEYFSDELKVLDIRLYLQIMLEKKSQSKELFEQLKGLVLSEEEVLRHLNLDMPPEKSDPQAEELKDKLEKLEWLITKKREVTLNKGILISLPYFSRLFNLSRFEEKCIILCLALEMDRKYEKIYGFLQDDITCKRPGIDLAVKLFCSGREEKLKARLFFQPNSKLCKFFLEREDEEESNKPFLSRIIRLDKRVTSIILGTLDTDTGRFPYAELVQPGQSLDGLLIHGEINRKLCDYAEHRQGSKENGSVFFLWGNTGSGKELQAKHFCRHFKKVLMLADLKQILSEDQYEAAIDQIFREAVFLQAVICVSNFDALTVDEVSNYSRINHLLNKIDAFAGDVFILSNKAWKLKRPLRKHTFTSIELGPPEGLERIELWESYGRNYLFDDTVDFNSFSNKFKFTPGQIKNALLYANNLAEWEKGSREIGSSELAKACYLQVNHKLEKKAQLIRPKYTWEDLVLPEDVKQQLRNASNQIKYRHIVYGQWGFGKKLPYGRGLSMLYSGPPGTGKTMAAQVIARELSLELYKIDLSQVISKYIGETEKNLNEIFNEAEYSNAILFFDETDALFGKRSEVKDSHDKYANIETAYLLQKMEEFDGISVMATNFLQNIDEAFMRRINYIIKFPFPDAKYRELLWKSMYTRETPLSEDIDFGYLAERFHIAGGNIKNIVIASAFLAAENGEPVSMKHIVNAAKYELEKSGKILLKEDLGEYY